MLKIDGPAVPVKEAPWECSRPVLVRPSRLEIGRRGVLSCKHLHGSRRSPCQPAGPLPMLSPLQPPHDFWTFLTATGFTAPAPAPEARGSQKRRAVWNGGVRCGAAEREAEGGRCGAVQGGLGW